MCRVRATLATAIGRDRTTGLFYIAKIISALFSVRYASEWRNAIRWRADQTGKTCRLLCRRELPDDSAAWFYWGGVSRRKSASITTCGVQKRAAGSDLDSRIRIRLTVRRLTPSSTASCSIVTPNGWPAARRTQSTQSRASLAFMYGTTDDSRPSWKIRPKATATAWRFRSSVDDRVVRDGSVPAIVCDTAGGHPGAVCRAATAALRRRNCPGSGAGEARVRLHVTRHQWTWRGGRECRDPNRVPPAARLSLSAVVVPACPPLIESVASAARMGERGLLFIDNKVVSTQEY